MSLFLNCRFSQIKCAVCRVQCPQVTGQCSMVQDAGYRMRCMGNTVWNTVCRVHKMHQLMTGLSADPGDTCVSTLLEKRHIIAPDYTILDHIRKCYKNSVF